ncbi:AMP-binding protein [Sulfurimonas sp.]|uniref:AMP-binding protein n=1 Tax=Sulfurimonas sp. TaxID=2022749 RepID=UPI0025DF3683|nr:AMP-binding protein [Sulfurimonas sp.]
MNYPYNDLNHHTLPNLLNRSIRLYKERPSFGMVDKSAMSYGEFMERVKQAVELLQINGISKGDKVLLLSENMPNWGVAYFAITYFGAVVVPVLVDFHPEDIISILKHSEARAIFTSDKQFKIIKNSKESEIKLIINIDELKIINKPSNYSIADNLSEANLISTEPLEDDLAAIIYTSGTTGNSKGVMLSHKNIVTNAMSSFSKVKILPSDVFLSILPLAHTFECTAGMIVPVLHGSSVYYIDKIPTPSILIKAFSSVKPTMMFSVPLIIEKIYKNKVLEKFNSSFIMRHLYKIPFFRKILNRIAGKKLLKIFGGRLKFFAIGGAALSPFVEEFLIEANFPYIVGYGITETAPLIAGSVIGEKPRLKSTGTAFAGVEIKIKKTDPNDKSGEILVKSPSVMMGYYKDKQKTAEVMEDGWFLTGDLGYIDGDGFLFIDGRSKNVIISSSGENIYPEQIESIINQQEAVVESLVIESGGKIVAKVHLDEEFVNKKFDALNSSNEKVRKDIANYLEEMRNNVNSQVSSFSRIVKFEEQLEPFIKTPTKKIKRYLYVD